MSQALTETGTPKDRQTHRQVQYFSSTLSGHSTIHLLYYTSQTHNDTARCSNRLVPSQAQRTTGHLHDKDSHRQALDCSILAGQQTVQTEQKYITPSTSESEQA